MPRWRGVPEGAGKQIGHEPQTMEAKSQSRRQRQGVNFNDSFFLQKSWIVLHIKINFHICETVLLFDAVAIKFG